MKKLIFTIGVMGSILLSAQTVTDLSKAATWAQPRNAFKNGILTYCKQWRIVASCPMIRIDPQAQYTFEAEFKSEAPLKKPLFLSMNFAIFDKNKKELQPYQVIYRPRTETVLTEAVKPGDKVIKIKDGSRWGKGNYVSIAFNIKDNYKDLPNYEVLNTNASFVNKGSYTEIHLKQPVKKHYPAGTRVRQHIYSMSMTAFRAPVTAKWTGKKASISGISQGLKPYDTGKWWAGAVYFRPSFSTGRRTDEKVLIRNIKMTVKDMNSIF